MSEPEKDVNLSMADLNINKDHDTTEASNVITASRSQQAVAEVIQVTDIVTTGTRDSIVRGPSYRSRRSLESIIHKVHEHFLGSACEE